MGRTAAIVRSPYCSSPGVAAATACLPPAPREPVSRLTHKYIRTRTGETSRAPTTASGVYPYQARRRIDFAACSKQRREQVRAAGVGRTMHRRVTPLWFRRQPTAPRSAHMQQRYPAGSATDRRRHHIVGIIPLLTVGAPPCSQKSSVAHRLAHDLRLTQPAWSNWMALLPRPHVHVLALPNRSCAGAAKSPSPPHRVSGCNNR